MRLTNLMYAKTMRKKQKEQIKPGAVPKLMVKTLLPQILKKHNEKNKAKNEKQIIKHESD